MPSPPPTPEQVSVFLAGRRLRHHGWARFQAGNRRSAIRMVRKLADDRCPTCYSADGHHVHCPNF